MKAQSFMPYALFCSAVDEGEGKGRLNPSRDEKKKKLNRERKQNAPQKVSGEKKRRKKTPV